MHDSPPANPDSAPSAPTNPLLDFSGLPRFADIKPAHVEAAIRSLIDENRALIERLTADPATPSWDGFVSPMDEAGERLGRAPGAWSATCTACSTCPNGARPTTPCCPRSRASTPRSGRTWRCTRSTRRCTTAPSSPPCRRCASASSTTRCATSAFSGAELPDEQKPRFQEIQEEQSQLAAKFSENLLDATPTPTPSGSPTRRGFPASPTTPARRPRRGRGQGRLEVHPADARLPASAAVRRRPRAARAHVPRLRHPRLRARQSRARQRPADRSHPRPAR